MGGIFSKPKVDTPPPVTPDPLPAPAERTSSEIASAAETQRRKYIGATPGRAATLLTGGLGVPSSSTSSAVSMLGGAART